jgi:hypothetical protein
MIRVRVPRLNALKFVSAVGHGVQVPGVECLAVSKGEGGYCLPMQVNCRMRPQGAVPKACPPLAMESMSLE